MSVFFRRRGEPPATSVVVTITGTGDSSKCYTIINGTKQYRAGTHEVNAGDTITFGLWGIVIAPATLTIDGTEVLNITDNSTQTYDWTVPSGISAIEIDMYFTSQLGMSITITVTTA